MPFFVYLLECDGKSYYCGWTKSLAGRLKAHNAGKGGAYTRAHRPVRLVYFEEKKTKSAALKREAEIKSLPRNKKGLLVKPRGIEARNPWGGHWALTKAMLLFARRNPWAEF